jgi:hypothetical protein
MKLICGCHSSRDVALRAAGLVLYPISKSIDWLIDTLAAVEWVTRRLSPDGSEMFTGRVDSQ